MPHYGQFFRNAFTERQQAKVRRSAFAIIGLGGTGGFALENLLRMGAEHFIVFDHDRFELTNFNRQLLATISTLDEPKADAALARAQEINPSAAMAVRGELTAHSSLAPASIVIDCSDNVKTRLAASHLAEREGIPYVFCSAGGTRGMVSVFRSYPFKKAFGNLEQQAGRRHSSRVICPAAALAGTLAASQAANCLTGQPCVRAPDTLFFDLFDKRVFWRAKLG
jgi:molybdopterin/thiamine biosynthesis adenylyltransferase